MKYVLIYEIMGIIAVLMTSVYYMIKDYSLHGNYDRMIKFTQYCNKPSNFIIRNHKIISVVVGLQIWPAQIYKTYKLMKEYLYK